VIAARQIVPDLLRGVAFRRFWLGQTISLVGDQVTLVALPLTAILVLHSTPAEMGYLSAAATLPNLVFSLHAGAFVDRRGRRRRTMILADLARAAAIATVPILYALDRLSIDQLYVVAFATGIFSVLFTVSYPTLFSSLVERDSYIEANSLISGSRAFSGVAGPSLAGLLVQVLTAPAALAIDALSFLASAAFMTAIDVEEPPAAAREQGSILAGARLIARTSILRGSLAATASVNFFTFGFVALFLLYANRSLGIAPGTLGIVLGIGSVGALLAAMFTGRISRRIGVGPTLVVGFLMFSAPLLLVPAAGGGERRAVILTLLLLAELGSGFGVMLLDITAGAIFLAIVPEQLLARFSGAYITANYGVRAFGSVAAGLMGTVVGVRPTLWIAAGGAVLSVLFLLPCGILRMRDLPASPPADSERVDFEQFEQ
jgi:MFS family permease